MKRRLVRSFLVAFHPKSPGAVYLHPGRVLGNLAARLLNRYLRIADALSPKSRVQCSVCGWRGRRFGFSGSISCDNFQSNQLCLACGSNAVTRTLAVLIEEHLDLSQSGMTVADVGPSPAFIRCFRRRANVRYITVDRFSEAHIKSDITAVPVRDNSVDVVICCHVIEHVQDYRKAIAELYRILKPQHYGIIAVPQRAGRRTKPGAVRETFQGYGHVWMFGDDFAGILAGEGFNVSTVYAGADETLGVASKLPFHIVSKPESSAVSS